MVIVTCMQSVFGVRKFELKFNLKKNVGSNGWLFPATVRSSRGMGYYTYAS